jgi:hypothetical protein
MRFARPILVSAVVAVSLITSAAFNSEHAETSTVSAPGEGFSRAVSLSDGRPISTGKHQVLDYDLALLSDAWATKPMGATGSFPLELRSSIEGGRLQVSDSGLVDVYVHTSLPNEELVADLEQLGGEVTAALPETGFVEAQVRISELHTIAAREDVRQVTAPHVDETQAGDITTEGIATLNIGLLRTAHGVDGSGVTIGVISDGVAGLADAQASGDLPAVDVATCNQVAGGDPGPPGRAEGTALLEIVHDVAPGASLMFGYYGTGMSGAFSRFLGAVDCLAANADIVVDDISWFNAGLYDGTSSVSENTVEALTGAGPIRGYYTSVGNQAQRHYQGVFADSGSDLTESQLPAGGTPAFWDLHAFAASAGENGTQHAGALPGPSEFNRLVLAPGGSAGISLQWDDAWGSSPNDYDVFVRNNGVYQVCSAGAQTGSQNPTESCSITNPTGTNRSVDIMIGRFNGLAPPVEFDMFLLCTGCIPFANGNQLDFNTPGSSVPNQADAGGPSFSGNVVSVGAARVTTPGSIQGYSSRGPRNDGRLKPDIIAVDGTCVTGAGGFSAGSPSCQGTGRMFFGTSAAAPLVAGIAALLLQCNASLTRFGLYDALRDGAIDLGVADEDAVYGYGRVDALASAPHAPCLITTPEPTATATLTPTQTLTATASATPTRTATATPTRTSTPTPTLTPTRTNTPSATPTPTPSCAPGDASNDSSVSSLDALLVLQFASDILDDLPCPPGGDADMNGTVNSIDAALILQFRAGLIDSLPP